MPQRLGSILRNDHLHHIRWVSPPRRDDVRLRGRHDGYLHGRFLRTIPVATNRGFQNQEPCPETGGAFQCQRDFGGAAIAFPPARLGHPERLADVGAKLVVAPANLGGCGVQTVPHIVVGDLTTLVRADYAAGDAKDFVEVAVVEAAKKLKLVFENDGAPLRGLLLAPGVRITSIKTHRYGPPAPAEEKKASSWTRGKVLGAFVCEGCESVNGPRELAESWQSLARSRASATHQTDAKPA